MVYGAPIACGRAAAPSDADVDAAHARYAAALRDLFDRNKGAFGYDGAERLAVL